MFNDALSALSYSFRVLSSQSQTTLSDIQSSTLQAQEQITENNHYHIITVLNKLSDEIDFKVAIGKFARKIHKAYKNLVLRENIC